MPAMPPKDTRFKPGQSGNPKGRPRVPEIEQLREAIKTVEKTKRKALLVHFVERAYKDDGVLIALGRKILPDMTKSEITGAEGAPIIPPMVIFEGFTPPAAGDAPADAAASNGHDGR